MNAIMERISVNCFLENAFTLIELLIVVAIIGILAAIAVPNFLNAQVRAKAARVKGDFQAIASALEMYQLDCNDYPMNDGTINAIPYELTTPCAYLSNANLYDPFSTKENHELFGSRIRIYTYTRIVNTREAALHAQLGHPAPTEGIDDSAYNEGALERYGKWRLVSAGPDGVYLPDSQRSQWKTAIDLPYDPSNGIVSFGNIVKAQKNPY